MKLDDPCTCGHARDDHRGGTGQCQDDECPCLGFDLDRQGAVIRDLLDENQTMRSIIREIASTVSFPMTLRARVEAVLAEYGTPSGGDDT